MEWPQVGDVIGDKWRVTKQAYPHTQNQIQRFYYVRNKDTNELANCVLESKIWDEDQNANANGTGPFASVTIYGLCMRSTNSAYLPQFICSGDHGNTHFVCTSPVGPTVRQLRDRLPGIARRRFSLFTCLHIGFEMLYALQEFHGNGFLHRIISPYTFGLTPMRPQLPLYGMAMLHGDVWDPRRWLSEDGRTAVKARPRARFRGTMRYSSVSVSRFQDATRVDDLWSWFYVLVDLTTGSLPLVMPQDVQNADLRTKLAWIANRKEALHENPSELLRSPSPPEYSEMLNYLKSAPRDPNYTPDYDRLADLLRKAMSRVARQIRENGSEPKLDWEPGGLYHNELSPLLAIDQ